MSATRRPAQIRAIVDRVRQACTSGLSLPAPAGWQYRLWRFLYGSSPLAGRRDASPAPSARHLGDRSSARPRVTILVLAARDEAAALTATVTSLLRQHEAAWELRVAARGAAGEAAASLANRPETAGRVLAVAADGDDITALLPLLQASRGDWVGFLDAGDQLDERALHRLAGVGDARGVPAVHCDEDRQDEHGRQCDPRFKPEWNPELLLGCDYVGQLLLLRRQSVEDAGWPRSAAASAWRYDLLLRVTAAAPSPPVARVPEVLFHARPGPPGGGANNATKLADELRVLSRHLAGCLAPPLVRQAPESPGGRRVEWPLPSPPPLVTVILATKDGGARLTRCLAGLSTLTTYRPYEVLVVDNASRDRATLDLLEAEERAGRLRALRCDDHFNISALRNRAARAARGEILAFLDDDIEVTAGEWLTELVRQTVRPGVGAVGARILEPDGKLWHAGMLLGAGTRRRPVAQNLFRGLAAADPGYLGLARVARDVSAVAGACMTIHREAWSRVGGFDEALAVAFEDVDLCLRLRQLGLRILWTPWAELIRHGSVRTGDPAMRARFARDVELMRSRWVDALVEDPFYSPNLDPVRADFALAFPPRR